jgi:hypothetical protein
VNDQKRPAVPVFGPRLPLGGRRGKLSLGPPVDGSVDRWLGGLDNPPGWRDNPPRAPMRKLHGMNLARPVILGALLGAACSPEQDAAPLGTGSGTGPAASSQSGAWFVEVTADWGLSFEQVPGKAGDFHMPEVMGGGLALFDADGDGDLDLYLVDGHEGLPEPDGTGGLNRLFSMEGVPMNGTGDGAGASPRFVDATEASGLGDRGYGMGCAVGDVEGDGDLDVYVTNWGPDRLFRNEGGGRFVDATEEAGLDVAGWSVSACFFDYDRDGLLDLFVVQYVDWDPAKACRDAASRPDYCGPTEFPPVRDVVLHNEGGGRFRDVSEHAGPGAEEAIPAAGLGVVSEDFDGDGWPDVYVANDAYANHLWINQRDGTFEEQAQLIGAAYNLNGQAEAGMGVVSEDFDGDGRFDLFMTHLGQETNTLYVNGSGFFSDTTGRSGLGPSSMRTTGFGTVAFDAELDGDLDLAIVNGRVVRNEPLPAADAPAPWDQYAEPNLFYVNDGGLRFRSAGAEGGTLVSSIEVTRGVVAGDLDGDGDDDLVITNIHGPARVYRNDAPDQGHWLAVRAVDPALGRDAVGARIELVAGDRRQHRALRAGAGYLSCGPCVARFGLGDTNAYDELRVRWPDGTLEAFPGGEADRSLVLERGAGRETEPEDG